MQLILEIAAGVILGLAGFRWLRNWYRDLQLRAMNRQIENIKAEIVRGFERSIRAIDDEKHTPDP